MLWNTLNQTVELGWDFYVPVIMFVALIALAVPVWAAIGAAAITMLVMSGDLPLSAVGESLFTGIDAFALTAVPLFILTGDVLVRTGLSKKFLDVAEALTCWTWPRWFRLRRRCSALPGACSLRSRARTRRGAAAVGRMTINRLVESGYPRPYACALVAAGACTGILIRRRLPISSSALYWAFPPRPVPGGVDPGPCDPGVDPDHQHHHEPALYL